MDKLYAAVADVHSSFDSNGLHDFLATPKTLESLALVGSFKWGLDFSDEEISTRIGPALREIVNSQRNARLHNLIIDGEPQFLDFGHHDCVRKEEKVLDVEINGDYLCGLPSLGSSSHLLSPSVPVRVIERSISRSNNDLPTLLIYEEGKAKEAKYDFQSAAFVAVEDGKQFDLEELYVSMPQMFRSYIKNRRSTKIPKNRRSKNLLKQISQDIVYANTRLNDFTQQVIDHFTFGGS